MRAWQYILCMVALCSVFPSPIAFASEANVLMTSDVGKNAGASPTFSSSLNGAFLPSLDGKIYFVPKRVSFWGSSSVNVGAELFLDLNVGVVSTIALSHDETSLYVTALDGRLYSVDVSARKVRWAFPATPRFGAQTRSSAAIDLDGNIYFGDSLGNFYSVKPDGTALFPSILIPDDTEIGASPTVALDGSVYFGSSVGKYYRFSPVDGSLLALESGLEDQLQASVASTSSSLSGDLLKARKNAGLYKEFETSAHQYVPGTPGLQKIKPQVASPEGAPDFGLEVLAANNELIGDDEFSFFASGAKIYAISYGGYEVASFDVAALVSNVSNMSLSAPAVVSNDNGKYVIYYVTSSEQLFEQGSVFGLEFDGSEFTLLWSFEQDYEKYRHYASGPIIDPDGDVHVITTEGAYALLEGTGQSPTFWGMFGGGFEHRRSLPDIDRDGCPDAIDMFSSNPLECRDNDADGIGDNADLDDDQDGIPDTWEDSMLQPIWDSEYLVEGGSEGFLRKPLASKTFSAFDDKDQDGLQDYIEYQLGGNPALGSDDKIDSDGDGFYDLWEVRYSPDSAGQSYIVGIDETLDTNSSLHPLQDADGDGLTNLEESIAFTNPFRPDSDLDGISDAIELSTNENYYESFNDLLCEDVNSDGLIDIDSSSYGLNPLNGADGGFDFDCDGYTNAEELNSTVGHDYTLNQFDDRVASEEGLIQFIDPEGFRTSPSNLYHEWGAVKDLMVSSDGTKLVLFSLSKYWVFDRDINTGTLTANEKRQLIEYPYLFSYSDSGHPMALDKANDTVYFIDDNTAAEGFVTLKSRRFDTVSHDWAPIAGDPELTIPATDDINYVGSEGELIVPSTIDFSNTSMSLSANGRYLGIAPGAFAGVLVFEIALDGSFTFLDHINTSTNSGVREEFYISNDGSLVYVNWRVQGVSSQNTQVFLKSNGRFGDVNGVPSQPLASTSRYCFQLHGSLNGQDAVCGFGSFGYSVLTTSLNNQTLSTREQFASGSAGNFIGAFSDKNIFLQQLNVWHLGGEGYYEFLGRLAGATLSGSSVGAASPDFKHLYLSSTLDGSERLVSVLPFPVAGNGRPDSDGDGVEDKDDKFVDDPRFASDIDSDGRPDDFVASCDAACQAQSGFPELALDQDDDGDGFPDFDINGGIVDETDFFPDDPLAWQDTDRDGMPDSLVGCDLICTAYSKYTIDTDDDNDGFDDVRQAPSGEWEVYDQFPKDAQEWFDTDSDGVGNNTDLDDDGDGVPDGWEVQYGLNPFDASDANEDWDLSPKVGGGVYKTPDSLANLGEFLAGANPYLRDTDLDGYVDIDDAFATDPLEWVDLDGDRVGDNSDSDTDGDEIVDTWETFYSDPSNTLGNPVFDSLSNNATDLNVNQQTAPNADPDGDGATNQLESQFGTNPYLADSDDDGIGDLYEITYSEGVLPGASDLCEYDEDGKPKRFAAKDGLLPNSLYSPDTDKDNDCDRYSNELEYELGFDPLRNEFDDQIVWDAESGQRITRIAEADAMEPARPWNISDTSKLLLLGDHYLLGSHSDSPIFKYDEQTGQLAWVGQVTFPWFYASENFLNTAAAPDGSGFYFLERNHIRKYIFDGETTFTGPTIVGSNVPFIGNISASRPEDLQNQDRLPLSYTDEYVDIRTLNSASDARLQTRLTFSESGELLFWATVGESGVLVYDRSPSGALNFLMHLTDDDQLDEYGAPIKHISRASVIANETLNGVIIASPIDTGADVAIYQRLESGLFGSNSGPNIALATSFVPFAIKDIHQGLRDNEFVVAGDDNTYAILVWDAEHKEFIIHSEINSDESFTGVSRVNGVAQFGLTSFVRKEVSAFDETGEAWTKVVYERFHSSVDILRNECVQENIYIGCTQYGDVELTSWPGSAVMMPNGRHRYYLEKRGLYPEHIGVVGLPVDLQGLGRPDQDNDGVEDLFDEFVNNSLEWLDTDQDGIGNNADPDDDNDGLSDLWEKNNCRLVTGTSECDSENPLFHPLIAELSENGDFDGDGLTNIEEVRLGTDPRKKDTDGDLVWDSWEFVIESDPLVFDSNLDPDFDGYSNLRESQLGTPIYLNTFDSRSSTLLSAYDALDVTDSGLQMPDLSEQSVLSIANDGKAFVIADRQAIHFFTKDDEAVVSYWASESLPNASSLALSFNASGDRLYVFYTDSSNEPFRRSYTVDLDTTSLVLEEEVPLSTWDGMSLLSSEEYGAAYFPNKIYATDDNRFVYVQADGVGFLRYQQRSDGTLEFEGYESSFSGSAQSAIFSEDFDQSKFYQLNADQLDIYLRDQATGELRFSKSITNAELVGEQVEEIAFGANSELLLSGDLEIASLTVGEDSANKRLITSPGGELEVNEDLPAMRYLLGSEKLKTYSDDGSSSLVYDELVLEHQGVFVAPITSDLEKRGNYLFVVATNNVDARHLLIYEGAIEGTGSVDSDNDGILDSDDALPYNPNESIDDDGDGCGDAFEDKFLGDIDRCLDTDQDGLSNEVDDSDDDNDGLTDIFENAYAANATNGCAASTLSSVEVTNVNEDIDGDGLSYLAEQAANTDPCNPDTDGDSILDGQDALPLSYSLAPIIQLSGEPIMVVERGLKLRSAEDIGFIDPMAAASDPRYGALGTEEFVIDKTVITEGVEVDYSGVDFDNVGIYEAVYSIKLSPYQDQITPISASVTRQIQVVDTLPPEIVLNNGTSLSVEQGPNYLDWAGFINHNRTITPSFADVFIDDAHATDQGIVTTVTYKGTTSPVEDWTLFNGSLAFDNTSDYCIESTGDTVEYNCIYFTHVARDDFGNESSIQRLVRVYPQAVPEFSLRDMPTCEAGDEVCKSSLVAVASDNAFVPRAPDRFEEVDETASQQAEPQEIIQTWNPLVSLIARDNVDGVLVAKVTAKVISYQASSNEENIPQFDLTNYGSGQVQYLGPKGSDYYLEDNAGNRSLLSRLDRHITIGDNQSPELRICGRSRDYVELGEPYVHASFPLYDDLDTNNRYKLCDEASIAFFAEDASDGYLLACADGQTTGCVEVRYSNWFDVDAPPLGEHVITYTAKDKSNASDDVSLVRVVEVVPQEDPTIELVGANPLLWNQNARYIDPGVILTDNSEREVSLSVDDSDVNVTQAGVYEVRYRATDVSGNSSEATRSIDVRDVSAPIVRVLGNNPAYVVNGQSYVDLGAYVSDNVRVVDYQPSGLPLEPNFDSAATGTYQVTYRAVDEAGNETIDTRDVIVGPEDNEPPTLVLTDERASFNSGAYFINHNQGEVFSPVQVEAFDNEMGDLRSNVERDGLVDVNVPGVYQQVLTVRDQAGNRSVELKVTVSVRDNEAPIITLNGEENLYVDPADSLFIDPNGSVTDNIDGDLEWSAVQVSIEFDNGESVEIVERVDLEQVGKFTLTYSIADSSGNLGQAKRYVYSLHPQEPFLSLVGGSPVYVEQNSEFVDPGVTVLDLQDALLSSDDVSIVGSIDTSVPGEYQRSYSVTDSDGNESSVSRWFIVADRLQPLLTLIGPSTLTLECGVAANDPGASAFDMVDGDLTSLVTVDQQLFSESLSINTDFEQTETRQYSVSDLVGNTATMSRIIRVEDRNPPTIQLSQASPFYVEAGASFVAPAVSANDLCSGDVPVNKTGSVNTGALGSYVLTFNASDQAGLNAGEVVLEVIVRDTLPPELIVNPELIMQHEQGTAFVDPGATAVDLFDGDLTDQIVIEGSVNSNAAGSYDLVYRVSDSSGNTSQSVTRTVIVSDTTPPTITLNGLASIDQEQGMPYSDAGATANDSVDGDVSANIVVTSNVDDAMEGTYTVTYNVSDAAGNAATPVTRAVTVSDTTAPEISLIGADTINVEQGTSYAEQGATAIDTVDGDLTANIVVGGETVDPNVAGTYIVTYSVVDAAGNAALPLSRTVIVSDTTPPTITLNGSASIQHEQGVAYTDAGATANDSVDGDVSANIVVTSNVDDAMAGTYTLTYNVSDAAGNAATPVTRTVTVSDTTAPEISLIGASTVNVEQGTNYTEQGASASDAVDGDLTANIAIGGDMVNANIAGTYTVTYNVSDAAGNLATPISRTIVVADTTAPTINLNGPSLVDQEQGVAYIDAGAVALDNVDGDLSNALLIDASNVDVSTPGQYTVVFSVVDSSGNNAMQARQVRVLDSMPPSITLLGDAIVQHELDSTYIDAHVSASDSVDGDLTSAVNVQSDVNVNVIGDYTIRYSVFDSAGNQSETLVRQVFVRDTIAPELSLLGDTTITIAQGEPYSEPGYISTDLGVDISYRVVVTGSVDSAAAGSYTLTYSVSDESGNAATSLVRTVVVGEVFEVEAGRAYLAPSSGIEFTFIPFQQQFETAPVVFALIDNTNAEPATIRIRNVTTSGFEAAQVEAGSGNAQPEGITPAIEFPYMAAEKGVHTIAPGVDVEVGAIDITNNVGRSIPGTTGYRSVPMAKTFTNPIVLGQVQTTNNALTDIANSLFLTTSVNSVSNSAFNIALERSEVSINSVVSPESVGYLIIDSATQFQLSDSSGELVKLETLSRSNQTLSGDLRCNSMAFAHSYSDLPLLLGNKQIRAGNNGGWLRQCALTTSTAGVLIQEDWTDAEIYHVPENVGALVIERPFSAKVSDQ